MRTDGIDRRTFIKDAGLLSLATAGLLHASEADAQQVPNSSGTELPSLKAPSRACDSHMHVYDPEHYPLIPNPRVPPTNAAVPQYQLLRKRIGTTRVVVVTPRNYGTDNRAMVDAIARLGNARGIAVVHPTVTDAELKALHAAGVRGIRFSLGDPASAVTTVDMVEPLAKRIADLGWHVQLNLEGERLAELADLWRRLPTQMVFDHLGNPPVAAGIDHASHKVIRELIDKGRAWVKLSGAYMNSRIGPPSYPEATKVAQAFVKAAPERLVWGSDWPHPTEAPDHKPDDAKLFDLLTTWAPGAATRQRILVDNPETLYGFAKG